LKKVANIIAGTRNTRGGSENLKVCPPWLQGSWWIFYPSKIREFL